MNKHNSFLLWENEDFRIETPINPATSYSEGLHVVVAPKKIVSAAWEDIELSTKAFELAAKACKVMSDLDLAPWFNIQANGNWGLLPGNSTFFHIHIHGRNKTVSWGRPIKLPELPGTYNNKPMPEKDRLMIQKALKLHLK